MRGKWPFTPILGRLYHPQPIFNPYIKVTGCLSFSVYVYTEGTRQTNIVLLIMYLASYI